MLPPKCLSFVRYNLQIEVEAPYCAPKLCVLFNVSSAISSLHRHFSTLHSRFAFYFSHDPTRISMMIKWQYFVLITLFYC